MLSEDDLSNALDDFVNRDAGAISKLIEQRLKETQALVEEAHEFVDESDAEKRIGDAVHQRAAAAARDRGGGESSTDVVEESPADGSERPGEDRSREAMRSGSCAAGAKPRKPRPSSWRRRRDAARRMSAAAREDASSPETSAVPETPEACMWNRIGDAAAESSGHDDGYEARNEARERGERARAKQ